MFIIDMLSKKFTLWGDGGVMVKDLTPWCGGEQFKSPHVATPLWRSCEVATHTPENGTWESSRTPKNLERDCRGQKTSHWGVFGTIGKVLKFRCPKWTRMSHLDICSTSYGRKKGRESNWQFDSRPLKVRNRPDFGACRWSATHSWKDLDKSYNFGLDLVPIRVWGEKLWASEVLGVKIGTVSGLHFGSPRKKSHLDVGAAEICKEYYMGEGGGFPRVWAVVSQVSPSCPWLVPTPKRCRMSSNQLVGWICRIDN
jgi:hypothetical protein